MTRPFLTYLPTNAGLEMPSDDELAALLKIVRAVYPWLVGFDLGEFRRSFWAQGQHYRTPATRHDRYYHAWVDDACDLLERQGAQSVEGPSFLAAIIAAGDVFFQLADPPNGALVEVGLNPHTGRRVSNVWRDILSGRANLLPPARPREPDRTVGLVNVANAVGVRWK